MTVASAHADRTANHENNALFESLLDATSVQQQPTLAATYLETPLGPMAAMADNHALYLLEFIGQHRVEWEVQRLKQKHKFSIIPGDNQILRSIKQELKDYFQGKCRQFKTPIKLLGTPFQRSVWQTLQTIPIGKTLSYLDVAKAINKPTAYRAVANANGANQLAIIVPCHRVINANGQLGGYGGGLDRKQWLLDHEKG